jgi:hypothetical protein
MLKYPTKALKESDSSLLLLDEQEKISSTPREPGGNPVWMNALFELLNVTNEESII